MRARPTTHDQAIACSPLDLVITAIWCPEFAGIDLLEAIRMKGYDRMRLTGDHVTDVVYDEKAQ